MDSQDLQMVEERLTRIHASSVADILQKERLGTEDNFESLAPSVQSALDIIDMIPVPALRDLPQPALRAVLLSLSPLLNLEGHIKQYGANGSPRTREKRQEIEALAEKLFDNTMSRLTPALLILCARQNAKTRASRAYKGREGWWNVLGEIGHGGQGAVSRAWNPATCMAGALKIVKPDGWRDKTILAQRLREEIKALDRLKHPNVLQLVDYGEDPEPFIVTQIAAFGTLHEWLPTMRGDIARVISLARCAANGIKHAHDQGVIHRDIKPSNLFMLSPDTVAVGDFGILWDVQQQKDRLTNFAEGTAADRDFAPPEAHGRDYVPQKAFDIFSLGATIHCALWGEYPMRPYWYNVDSDYEQLSVLLKNSQLAVIDDFLKPMLSKNAGNRPTIDKVCDALARLPIFPQGERKKEHCPLCGGTSREVVVHGGLLFGGPQGNFAPKAWRCDSCKVALIYAYKV